MWHSLVAFACLVTEGRDSYGPTSEAAVAVQELHPIARLRPAHRRLKALARRQWRQRHLAAAATAIDARQHLPVHCSRVLVLHRQVQAICLVAAENAHREPAWLQLESDLLGRTAAAELGAVEGHDGAVRASVARAAPANDSLVGKASVEVG